MIKSAVVDEYTLHLPILSGLIFNVVGNSWSLLTGMSVKAMNLYGRRRIITNVTLYYYREPPIPAYAKNIREILTRPSEHMTAFHFSGKETITLYGSPMIMSRYSPFIATMLSSDDITDELIMLPDFDFEAFMSVWSYINSIEYDIENLLTPDNYLRYWSIWNYIAYFAINLNSQFVRRYVGSLLRFLIKEVNSSNVMIAYNILSKVLHGRSQGNMLMSRLLEYNNKLHPLTYYGPNCIRVPVTEIKSGDLVFIWDKSANEDPDVLVDYFEPMTVKTTADPRSFTLNIENHNYPLNVTLQSGILVVINGKEEIPIVATAMRKMVSSSEEE